MVDVVDVTSGRTGVAIELKLVPDVDVVAALDWLRAIWPAPWRSTVSSPRR